MKQSRVLRGEMPHGTPRSLAEAEDTFGLDRVLWRRRKASRKVRMPDAPPENTRRCRTCQKVIFASKAEARVIIGKMLRKGDLTGDDVYTFAPYVCPEGYWHNGHDYRLLNKLTDRLKLVNMGRYFFHPNPTTGCPPPQ